ncbi:MAG: ATP-binding cassette domain-containing protein [Eubacterium sp.]|nr:ATP-binding cassette domain-containing protein [Eubacterium sp.]
MDKFLSFENVTKIYDGKVVINDLSHEFRKGEAVAFTGHNGCGKSTLLKIIAGLVRINKGRIVQSGKLRCSYVPEKMPAPDITALSYLKSVADMERVDHSEVMSLAEDFFLDGMLYTKMGNMSKGSIQKIGVVQALMAPKDIILLDEPLNGQDADSQNVFIAKINELKSKGVTVFMSCHEKKLINEIADKQYDIIKGKLSEVDIVRTVMYRVYVKNGNLVPWPDMVRHGHRYIIEVREKDLKDTVQKLYAENWELVGIDESN